MRKYLIIIILVSFNPIFFAAYKIRFYCTKCSKEYSMSFNSGEMIENNKGYCCDCKALTTVMQNFNNTDKIDAPGKIVLSKFDWDSRNYKNSGLPAEDLNDVIYENNTFIAVGNNGTILTSLDGVKWTNILSGVKDNILKITYGSNNFVAFGKTAIITSKDGISWKDLTVNIMGELNVSGYLEMIAYGNDTFVILTSKNEMLMSNDGVKWEKNIFDLPQGTANQIEIGGIAFGNSKFVIIGNIQEKDGYPVAILSIDGKNWSMEHLKLGKNIYGLNFSNNIFIARNNDNKIFISKNGIDWTEKGRIIFNTPVYEITYYDDTFYALGWGGIFASIDGIYWTNKISITCDSLLKMVYGNDSFVAVGMSGVIFHSNTKKNVNKALRH